MDDNMVKVDIFANSYSIHGDTSPEYMQRLAAYVDEKMNEVNLSVTKGNPLQIAILAALNIADEMFQLKEVTVENSSEIDKKAELLISMLDEGLIGDSFVKSLS